MGRREWCRHKAAEWSAVVGLPGILLIFQPDDRRLSVRQDEEGNHLLLNNTHTAKETGTEVTALL